MSLEQPNTQESNGFGSAVPSLAHEVAQLLIAGGLTVATAESCTGGLLSATLTGVPGSSAYFPGGIVAYDNSVKTALLGVNAATIEQHGAVSAPVALEMAHRTASLLGADIGIGVTGIAGPSGGTVEKPVGTTFIAVVAVDIDDVRGFRFKFDRDGNRSASVQNALEMLLSHLQTRSQYSEASTSRNEVTPW